MRVDEVGRDLEAIWPNPVCSGTTWNKKLRKYFCVPLLLFLPSLKLLY